MARIGSLRRLLLLGFLVGLWAEDEEHFSVEDLTVDGCMSTAPVLLQSGLDLQSVRRKRREDAIHIAEPAENGTDSDGPDALMWCIGVGFTAAVVGGFAYAIWSMETKPPTAVEQPPAPSTSLKYHLQCRVCCEWQVIRARVFPEWFCITVFVVYLDEYVFRTLAFFRHRQIVDYIPESWCVAIANSRLRPADWKDGDSCTDHARSLLNQGALKDVLHEMFPNHDESGKFVFIPEVVQVLSIFVIASVMIYGSFVRRPGPSGKRPYMAVVLTRVLRVFVVMHAFRPLFYLLTSLPGPASKCVGPQEQHMRPKSAWEAFYNFHLGAANCGDLLYSGHITSLMVIACTFFHYGRRLLEPQVGAYNVARVVIGLLTPVQGGLVAVAHSHYSIDVAAALVITPMVWRLYDYELGPDVEPGHFVAANQETTAQCQAQSQTEALLTRGSEMQKDKVCADDLLAMSDQEMAEHLQFEGLQKGIVMMILIVLAFFGIVGLTIFSLLGQ